MSITKFALLSSEMFHVFSQDINICAFVTFDKRLWKEHLTTRGWRFMFLIWQHLSDWSVKHLSFCNWTCEKLDLVRLTFLPNMLWCPSLTLQMFPLRFKLFYISDPISFTTKTQQVNTSWIMSLEASGLMLFTTLQLLWSYGFHSQGTTRDSSNRGKEVFEGSRGSPGNDEHHLAHRGPLKNHKLSEWRDPVWHWNPLWGTTSRVSVCWGQQRSSLLCVHTHTHRFCKGHKYFFTQWGIM